MATLKECGVTAEGVRQLIRKRVLRRVLAGVFVPAGLPDSPELRARCAAAILPAHSVVCDRTAAWIWGVDDYDDVGLELSSRLDIAAVGGPNASRRPEAFGCKRALSEEDVVEVGGIRVTTPLRTACDLAMLRGRHHAIAILDAFRREHDLHEADLVRMLPRLARRRGVVQLRELIPLSTPAAESSPESWMRIDVHDEGFTGFEPQIELHLPDFGDVRLDLGHRRLKIAIEYDGERHHTSPADRARDEARRAALKRAGWIVIVIRKDGFSGVGRAAWVAELREAVVARTPAEPTKRVYARGSTKAPARRRTARPLRRS